MIYTIGDFVASFTDGKYHLGFIRDIISTTAGNLYLIEYIWDEDGNPVKPFLRHTFFEYIGSGFKFLHERVEEKKKDIKRLQSIEEHI